MSEELCILNGGVQTVAPLLAAPQVVYLDFDGASTSYVNADLGIAIDNVTVEDSGFGDGDIAVIVDALNGMFDDVSFTSSLPADGEFSTIYIGVTSAFDEYGSFLGLAETIDSGNIIRDDNAFVLLDSSADAELVVSVIAHETEHIVHGLDHGGDGMERFATDYDVGSGQVSSGVIINYRDSLKVPKGGMAINTTVNGGGFAVWGGSAVSTTMNSGKITVWGGTTTSTTVKGGSMLVEDGAVSITTVSNGGTMDVFLGGVATDTTVNGGLMKVSSTAVVSITKVSGGSIFVSSGATATITTVSRGRMVVEKRGTATSTTLSAGRMEVSGGTATSTTVSGLVGSNWNGSNYSIFSSVEMWVYSNGVATITTVTGGRMSVYNGGAATSTTLSRGWQGVYSGGMATSTTINYTGWLDVWGGGSATIMTVNGGGMIVSKGGAATSTTVIAGEMWVLNNGYVTSTTVSGGKMQLNGGVATITTVSGGSMLINAATVFSTTVSGGSMLVNGGTVVSTTVRGGSMLVNVGNVTSTDVSGGSMLVNGGTVTSTDVSGGSMIVKGGTVNNTTVKTGAVMSVFENGKANITSVGNSGSMLVYSNGITTSTTVNGGVMSVYSSGTANITTLDPVGKMSVYSGGTANDTTVNSGGTLSVLVGGKANDTVVSANFLIRGSVVISAGGEANGTTLSGGFMGVFDGGVANSTTASRGGNGNATLGSFAVYKGGTAKNTTVDGGRMTVYSSLAKNTTVNSGGQLFISEGGVHGGRLQIADGAIVYAYTGAAIDFTVAEQEERGSALVNRYDCISGETPAFTITVSGDEGNGDYALAGSASAFNSTVTVKTTSGDELGSLKVGGSIKSKKTTYSLNIDDSDVLSLNIYTDNTPPTVSELKVGTPGKDETAVVSIIVSETLSKGLYSWNGGEWTELGFLYSWNNGAWIKFVRPLTVSENGVVRFQLTDLVGNVATTDEYTIEAFNVLLTDVKCQTDGNSSVVDWSRDGTMEWSRSYDALLSNDAGVISVDGLAASGLELLNLPGGEMTISVKPGKSDLWTELNALEIPDASDESLVAITGVENGMAEVMFARGGSVWGGGYRAWHAGVGDWGMAGQAVELKGRNVIGGVFTGSDDSTILVLTDDGNGDALFLDDIYSAYPDGSSALKRLSKVNEIMAGAGNDVVDLTSPRFGYADGGVTVHGGLGDDVIWANSGVNRLFGDAGDDRIVGGSGDDVIVGGAGDDVMHGGGGDDIFCFCSGWGKDTVEQTATGKVTLWFADGDESKWDAEKLTYTNGDNSVTVAGVTSTNITLKFGDDGGQYSELQAAGAFDAFTSEKIFENKNVGLHIAS